MIADASTVGSTSVPSSASKINVLNSSMNYSCVVPIRKRIASGSGKRSRIMQPRTVQYGIQPCLMSVVAYTLISQEIFLQGFHQDPSAQYTCLFNTQPVVMACTASMLIVCNPQLAYARRKPSFKLYPANRLNVSSIARTSPRMPNPSTSGKLFRRASTDSGMLNFLVVWNILPP